MKTLLFILFALPHLLIAGNENPITEKIKSDIDGIYINISYDTNAVETDYNAETYSGLPDTGKYAIDRGVEKGLISFPCSGVRLKSFIIGKDTISKIIKMKYDMDVYDRTDFIITRHMIYIIHTSTSNAGIFTGSDIYILPKFDKKDKYETYFDNLDEQCSGDKKLFAIMLNFCIKHNIDINH